MLHVVNDFRSKAAGAVIALAVEGLPTRVQLHEPIAESHRRTLRPRRDAAILMALLLGVCGALLPQPGTAQSDAYRAGLEAFVAGNYEQALEELLIVYTNLQHSPAAGRQTATLRYNLGATYYRLGRHEAAANQFRLIVDDATLGDRARFNLGLLAAQRGDRAEAEALFEGVAESAACATLRARAAAKRKAPLTVDPGDAPDVIAPD